MVKNYDDILSRFHLTPECNEQTDRRTDLLYQYHASDSVRRRAIKIIAAMHHFLFAALASQTYSTSSDTLK